MAGAVAVMQTTASLTSLCDGGSRGWTKVPRHCRAMAVVAGLAAMHWDSRPSLACCRMMMMAAAETDGGGSGGGTNDSRGNGAALSAVPSPARATTSWWRGGQRCLGIVGRPLLTGGMLSW